MNFENKTAVITGGSRGIGLAIAKKLAKGGANIAVLYVGDETEGKAAKAELDSVGGVIECAVTGVEAGFGEPMFDGVEGVIAKAVFAIPAVKGVEFGAGFEASKMRGSQNNDPFRMENGRIVTETNNCGGILGGITNGMPVIFTAAIKPTPSIAQKQRTVNLETGENTELEIRGRHDPCIVPRAVPVIEAVTAIALINLI